MKQSIIILILILIATCASADPIILAPRGTTLSTGQYRAEAALSPSGNDGQYYWLGVGFEQYEFNYLRRSPGSETDQDQYGVQWNFLPETYFTPALSFGVKDITSQSHYGLAGYVAASRHLPIGEKMRFIESLSATVGIGLGGIAGPFGGIEAQFPHDFYAAAEFDSHNLNATIGWQPVDRLGLKLYTIQGDFFAGAELNLGF